MYCGERFNISKLCYAIVYSRVRVKLIEMIFFNI